MSDMRVHAGNMSHSVQSDSINLHQFHDFDVNIEKEFESPAKINLMKLIKVAGPFDETSNAEIISQDSDNDSQPNQFASDEGYTGSDENDARKSKREENMTSSSNIDKEEIISRLTDEEVLNSLRLLEERSEKQTCKNTAKIVHLASTADVLVEINQKYQIFLDKRLNKAKRIDSHSKSLMKHRLKNRRN